MSKQNKWESLYETANVFRDRCFLSERSFLWPEIQCWTTQNILEIKEWFIDNPIYSSELSFEQKLDQQLAKARPEHWIIIADIYYLYYLTSGFIKPETKKESISRVAAKANLSLPLQDDIWVPQVEGICNTGQKYHSKYSQFKLLIYFSLSIKEAGDATTVFSSAENLQKRLDKILDEDHEKSYRAFDMRHAMLYFYFPENHEPIISNSDRQKIISHYSKELGLKNLSQDNNKALFEIRKVLSESRKDLPDDFSFYGILREEWSGSKTIVKEESAKMSSTNSAYFSLAESAKNIIFYGPPGTGKTYQAQRLAEELVKHQVGAAEPKELVLQKAIEGLPVYEIIALSIYHQGKNNSYLVKSLQSQELIRTRFALYPVKMEPESLWAYLQEHTNPQSETVNTSTRREPFLFDKNSQSEWGLTENGIQYIEEKLSERLEILKLSMDSNKAETSDYVKIISFHQSYSYEEFIEGIRPEITEEIQNYVGYEIRPGVFKRLCARARSDIQNKYILIIDEINRGNIAKIFGELITLIEPDKRAGGNNAISTLLPYSQEEFSVPENLIIIGTMNTADRSISLLDAALRRRFAFIEIMPDHKLLSGIIVNSGSGDSVDLALVLESLNNFIRENLSNDQQIGHSYFLRMKDPGNDQIETLEFIWNYEIVPLLGEYFHGREETLVELFQGAEFQLFGDDLIYVLNQIAEKYSN